MSTASRKRQAEREGRTKAQARHEYTLMVGTNKEHGLAAVRTMAKDNGWAFLEFELVIETVNASAFQMIDDEFAQKLSKQFHLERKAGAVVHTVERELLVQNLNYAYEQIRERAFPNAKCVMWSVSYIENSRGVALYRSSDYETKAA